MLITRCQKANSSVFCDCWDLSQTCRKVINADTSNADKLKVATTKINKTTQT